MTEYRQDIDVLKGFAIFSVVLFHMGILNSGYLGVDIFFVVNGFLVIPKIVESFSQNKFSYSIFFRNKYLRILPLVVLASFICLLIGCFGLLPENLKNLSEAIIAGNLFSENIFLNITTRDYWDISNNFKPLMHLWYIGVLMEFYILFPLLLWIGTKILQTLNKKTEDNIILILSFLFTLSLILYLLPYDNDKNKFFFLHYRLFEILSGGVVGLICARSGCANRFPKLHYISITLLIFVVLSGLLFIQDIGYDKPPIGCETLNDLTEHSIQSKPTLLLLTVFLSCFILYSNNSGSIILNSSFLANIGKRSYSYFIWHQIVFVFYRYFISTELTLKYVILTLAITIILSELSYRFIELRVNKTNKAFFLWMTLSFAAIISSLWIHNHYGVVRNIPELSINFSNPSEGRYSGYNGRVFDYDKDFPEKNGKKNILVIGNSFSRDIANCILESTYKDSINLSYIFELNRNHCERIKEADVVLIFSFKESVPDYFWKNLKEQSSVWGIGTKCYGDINEQIYIHRSSPNYRNTSLPIRNDYLILNEKLKKDWGDHYIDMIGISTLDNGSIRIFTPDGKFISHDCLHLSKDGASWFASQIDWSTIFLSNKQINT